MNYKALPKPIRFRTTVSLPDNFLAPDLKDLELTPGSILDLDADGRRDLKEMSLFKLCYLQRGFKLQFGHVVSSATPTNLLTPGNLPSTKLPAAPESKLELFPQACPEEQD